MKTEFMEIIDHAERHYRLAGAHALAAESKGRSAPAEIPGHLAEARGRLIAAAPDLLAACKAALECLAPTGQDTKSDRAINQIAAAITKAEAH